MRTVAKLMRLPLADWALLLEATIAVVGVRLALWAVEFGRLRAALDKLAANRGGEKPAAEPLVSKIAWAVGAIARRVPRATCLTQALATRWMLERRNVPATLRIGVARSSGRAIEAHAWLECHGRIVIGEAEAGRYKAFDTD